MNTDGTVFNTCKECHKTKSLRNHTTTDHKEGGQLEDRRNVGQNSCNFGDGTDQTVPPLLFMMMMKCFDSLLVIFRENRFKQICIKYENGLKMN